MSQPLSESIIGLVKKYSHAWLLSYFFIYMAWFTWLESYIVPRYWMHSPIDELIPFIPAFIIPYALWFAYVAATVVYFLITSRSEYYKLCAFLFIGMSICLTLYMVFPNGHRLRPEVTANSAFTWVIALLHKADTPTNVAPSIHVYNSIGVHLAISMSEKLKTKIWLRRSSFILMLSIIMSTVYLKQHSIDDVFLALPLCLVMYLLVYRVRWQEVISRVYQRKTNGENESI